MKPLKATSAARSAVIPAPPVRKAYSYLRFSTPDQGAGDSTRRQTQRAEDYVRNKEGLVLDTELRFRDEGISAFRGKNVSETGALGQFLAAVHAGQVPQGSVLLVESLDRVSRQSVRKAIRVLEQICEAGVSVVTLNDGREYTEESLDSDPMAFMLAVLTFIRSNEESVTKSNRVKAAWGAKRVKAAQGTAKMTSMLPAWLTSEGKDAPIKKIPEAAKVVKRLFKLYSEGKGVVAIQRLFNAEGVPTFTGPNGKKATMWHASYLNRLLRNPAVTGTFQPTTTDWDKKTRRKVRTKAGEPIKGYYPAVVDEDLFNRVKAMLGDTKAPGRGKAAQGELQNLFGGLAVCSRCGASMRRKTMSAKLSGGVKKHYAYFCCTKAMAGDGCTYGSTSYETVEAAFLEQAPALFAITPSGDEGLEAHLRATEEAVSELEAHRVKLRDLMLETGSRTFAADLQETEGELETLKATRDALLTKRDVTTGPVLNARLGDLRAALSADVLDKAKVNALLRSVLTQVVVDAEAKVAQLVWKHGGTSEVIFGVPEEASSRSPQRRTAS